MQGQAGRIAGLLYDGILSPEAWHAGMAAFTAAVGGIHFHQLAADLQSGIVLESIASVAAGNEKAVEDYDRHFALIDERLPIAMRLGQGQVMLDHEHFSERHMSRSALYTDCLAPQGMKYTLGLMLRVDGSVHQYVAFLRAPDQKPFSQGDRDFTLHLLPDAMRAAQLRARAGQLARHAALGLAALDTLAQAIAVVDAQCRIQYSNPAADRLLAHPGAMSARHGRLSCEDSHAQAQWQGVVAAACGRQGAAMAGALRSVSGARTVVVTVLPLHPHHPLAELQTPLALAVLHDPAAPGGLDPRLVGAMLGLSPTETRLALLLVTGKTLKQFASTDGMSWHTARSHAKNLMRKTGCHRQMELLQLLQSLQGA